MNEITTASLVIKGLISETTPEEQAKIAECRAKITEVVKEYGEEGEVALVVEGLEVMKEMME